MGDEQSGRMGGNLAQVGTTVTGLRRVDSQPPIVGVDIMLFPGWGEPRVGHKGVFSYGQDV